MIRKEKEHSPSATDPYAGALMDVLARQVENAGAKPETISRSLVSSVVLTSLPATTSEDVQMYIRDVLEGRVGKPRGRPKADNATATIKDILAPLTYYRYLAWLQRRRKTIGLDGWSLLRRHDQDWWQGPPHERAARMTCRRLRLGKDWGRLLRVLSENKK